MTSSDAELARLLSDARDWASQDPDPATAAALSELVRLADGGVAAARQELADSFSGTLQFGTAGLRAALGPGPNRMNRVVVRRAAAGFTAFLTNAVGQASPGTRPRAVVGYDARYNSDIFAEETAAILTAAGVETFLMPAALPTPLLAYAVRALDCDGGVMVTASHNPPQDNGYKVYLGRHAVEESGRGAQIVAPYDALIAAKIDAVGALDSIVLAADGWTVLEPSIATDYQRAVAALAVPEHFPARGLKIVLTPMHGVGGETAVAVLNAAGFDDVTLVTEQAQPDPDFPTVNFPNPEEPGALDLALEAATREDADIVIANDPDADRAAVAAKDPDTGALAHAARRRGRRTAGCPRRGAAGRQRRSTGRRVRQLDRVLPAAGADRGRGRLRARGNPDRLQVDCPGAGAGLRLRGGAGLLRCPVAGARQGRHFGRGPHCRTRGGRKGRGQDDL